jgi:hypothetical protein
MIWIGFVRKTSVEVVNVFGHVNVVRTNPTELFISIFVTEPLNKIPEFCPVAPVELRVNNLLDLEVFVTIDDFHGGWRRFLATREWVRKMRFELRNMENRMNLGERFR